jgi:hypothetical protein
MKEEGEEHQLDSFCASSFKNNETTLHQCRLVVVFFGGECRLVGDASAVQST